MRLCGQSPTEIPLRMRLKAGVTARRWQRARRGRCLPRIAATGTGEVEGPDQLGGDDDRHFDAMVWDDVRQRRTFRLAPVVEHQALTGHGQLVEYHLRVGLCWEMGSGIVCGPAQ